MRDFIANPQIVLLIVIWINTAVFTIKPSPKSVKDWVVIVANIISFIITVILLLRLLHWA